MNLLSMLQSANNPASSPVVAERKYTAPGSKALRNGNELTHEKAIELYRSAAHTEWTRTIDFEKRLGKSKSTALPSLRKWEGMGIVESRPAGGGFNRRRGLEWRFK